MPRTDFSFFLDIITSYISFGLAFYATGALIALIWMRRASGRTPARVLRDLGRSYTCVIILVLLEASRQIWDSFHYQHFPLWITRIALPCIYLVLGNSVFRIAGDKFAEPWTQVEVEQNVRTTANAMRG